MKEPIPLVATGALFAVPYWIAGLPGLMALPSTMPPLLWHAHQMLYGFAVAVIVGFLLTAGKAWTGFATPRGATLAATATALSLAAWVLLPAHLVTAAGFALAALLHATRLWHRQPWRTQSRPILWVLHAASAWLPVGFLLLAWGELGGVATSAGIHAMAVGATAGLIVGMVTRTARGHTGRPLKVSHLEVAAYVLLAGAAVARVLLPWLSPAHTAEGLVVAAAAWAAAFALYL